jgi:NAD(P)H dehydrogenase (quinone)
MILVLGAGGTVGRHLLAELDARDAEYRAAYRSPGKLEAAQAEGLDAVEIDLARPRTLRESLEDIDRVFLLTAATPQLTEHECMAVDELKKAGVQQIVKVSVWDADIGGYTFARWHHPVEKALADSGVPHVILRPNGFMQSLIQSMVATVRDHGAFYTPTGHHAAAYINARDIGRCAATLLTDRPAAPDRPMWTLSGPEALNASQTASMLGQVIRKPVRAVDVSLSAYREGLLAAGLAEWMADALVDLAAYQSDSSFGRVTEDVETLCGHAPGSLREFFEEEREDFLA